MAQLKDAQDKTYAALVAGPFNSRSAFRPRPAGCGSVRLSGIAALGRLGHEDPEQRRACNDDTLRRPACRPVSRNTTAVFPAHVRPRSFFRGNSAKPTPWRWRGEQRAKPQEALYIEADGVIAGAAAIDPDAARAREPVLARPRESRAPHGPASSMHLRTGDGRHQPVDAIADRQRNETTNPIGRDYAWQAARRRWTDACLPKSYYRSVFDDHRGRRGWRMHCPQTRLARAHRFRQARA